MVKHKYKHYHGHWNKGTKKDWRFRHDKLIASIKRNGKYFEEYFK